MACKSVDSFCVMIFILYIHLNSEKDINGHKQTLMVLFFHAYRFCKKKICTEITTITALRELEFVASDNGSHTIAPSSIITRCTLLVTDVCDVELATNYPCDSLGEF